MTSIERQHASRDALIAAIVAFLGEDLLTVDDVRAALGREIDAAGVDALLTLQARLTADAGWDYYPPDPLARRIHHLLADRFLARDSRLAGAEHLVRAGAAPTALFANHLSYADANVVEILLQRSAAAPIGTRLTAIAGPKVFTDRARRFSSLCFGTVKVPQSAEVSSEEAVLNTREVARAARHAIEVARARLAGGDALLLFGEGTRSRTGRMQPMLAGVARYLDVAGTRVVPLGITGSETLFPVDDSTLRPATVVMRAGAPISADVLLAGAGRDRRLVMDAIGLAIAELLPFAYRGAYEDPAGFTSAAALLRDARGASAVA